MEYTLLTEEEQDDIIVTFMQAQERDAFCHQINMERYDSMLVELPDDAFKKKIQGLMDETAGRLGEVTGIINATVKQMPDSVRIAASVARIKAIETKVS